MRPEPEKMKRPETPEPQASPAAVPGSTPPPGSLAAEAEKLMPFVRAVDERMAAYHRILEDIAWKLWDSGRHRTYAEFLAAFREMVPELLLRLAERKA